MGWAKTDSGRAAGCRNEDDCGCQHVGAVQWRHPDAPWISLCPLTTARRGGLRCALLLPDHGSLGSVGRMAKPSPGLSHTWGPGTRWSLEHVLPVSPQRPAPKKATGRKTKLPEHHVSGSCRQCYLSLSARISFRTVRGTCPPYPGSASVPYKLHCLAGTVTSGRPE